MEATFNAPGHIYSSTYDALKKAAEDHPNLIAYRYFLNGDCHDKQRIPVVNTLIHWTATLFGKAYARPYHEVSYSSFLRNVNRTANVLTYLGVGAQDVVSMVLPNFVETLQCLSAAEAVGIANPINPLLEPEIIKNILNEVKAKVLFTLGPTPGSDLWEKVNAIRKDVPSLEHIIVLKSGGLKTRGCLRYESYIRSFNPEKLDATTHKLASDIACYYHTGGSTGIPKIVKITHGNKLFSAAALLHMTKAKMDDAGLLVLPLFHVNGSVNCLAGAMQGLTTVIAGPAGFRTTGVRSKFFQIARHHHITYFSAVPTIYSALLQNPDIDHVKTKIRFSISGAAPLPQDVAKEFSKRSGIPIIEGYGQTEATVGSTLNPVFGHTKPGSVGPALPFTAIKTVMLENDQYVRDGSINEVGNIVVKGPHVCQGYLRAEHEAALWLEDSNQQRWMKTGDMGRLDSDGYLWLTGRSKELIIRGGHNIDPKLIEEPLHRHPAVALAAAVGQPDPYAGEIPVAYVQLKAGADISEEELLAFCQQQVGEKAAIPKAIRIVREIPLTPIGKIYKPQLVWNEIRYVIEEALNTLSSEISTRKIDVGLHATYGSLATIRVQVAPGIDLSWLEGHVKEKLKGFSFNYALDVT